MKGELSIVLRFHPSATPLIDVPFLPHAVSSFQVSEELLILPMGMGYRCVHVHDMTPPTFLLTQRVPLFLKPAYYLLVTMTSAITSSRSFLVSKVAGLISEQLCGIALTWRIARLISNCSSRSAVPYFDCQLNDPRKPKRRRILHPVTNLSQIISSIMILVECLVEELAYINSAFRTP